MVWEIDLLTEAEAARDWEQAAGADCWHTLQLSRWATGSQKDSLKKKALKRLIPFTIQCKYLLKE